MIQKINNNIGESALALKSVGRIKIVLPTDENPLASTRTPEAAPDDAASKACSIRFSVNSLYWC